MICRALFRLRFRGVENIPAEGACIIAPNHVTFLDPIWITIPIRRRVYYLAWDKLFRIPVLGIMMRIFGAFPVNIDRADTSAHKEATQRLRRGCALVVFPEGGRTKSGSLMPFKMGAFRLALTHGVPIVPVTLEGAYEVWPAGRLLPKPYGRVRVTFHPAIEVKAVGERCSKADVRQQARLLARRTMSVVAGVVIEDSNESASLEAEAGNAVGDA